MNAHTLLCNCVLKICMLITVIAVYPLNPCSALSLGSCPVMTLMRVPLVLRPVYTVIAILLSCSSRVYRARFPFCLAPIFSCGHCCVCPPSRYEPFVCVSMSVRIVVTDTKFMLVGVLFVVASNVCVHMLVAFIDSFVRCRVFINYTTRPYLAVPPGLPPRPAFAEELFGGVLRRQVRYSPDPHVLRRHLRSGPDESLFEG